MSFGDTGMCLARKTLELPRDHNKFRSGGRMMHNLNERFEEIESARLQDVHAEDTLVNWSLDDFSDIVPKPVPGDDRSLVHPLIAWEAEGAITQIQAVAVEEERLSRLLDQH